MIAPETSEVAVYTEALTRGGVLLDEMRTLLAAWQPGETAAGFGKRVRGEDILSKATARTISDYMLAFSRRFLNPDGTAARHLRRLLAGSVSRQVGDDVIWYYTARAEKLLWDFTTLCYWPAARLGRLTLSNDDVRSMLWEAELDGRLRGWSPAVKHDMPARVLTALAEFGLLGPRKAGRREILPYRPMDGTVLYLAHLLHEDGVTDASLAQQATWALFGLEPADVWHRLQSLVPEGWFVLQRAGQVVRITWKYQTVAEVVDELAGG